MVNHQKKTDSNPATIWFLALSSFGGPQEGSSCIYINVGSKEPPGSVTALILFIHNGRLSPNWLGWWNARVKGMTNWTKVQVPLQSTGRVPSTVLHSITRILLGGWLVPTCLSSPLLVNLQCIQTTFPWKLNTVPHTHLQREEVWLVPGTGNQTILVGSLLWPLLVGNRNEKFLQDEFLHTVLSWYREIM
jgi:hypothetical protein